MSSANSFFCMKGNGVIVFKKKPWYFIFWVFIFSILGAAKFNLFISNVHFKLSFILLFAPFIFRLLNGKIKFSILEIVFFTVFLIGSLVSLLNTSNRLVSIYYLIWMLFNFFSVFCLFKSIAKEYGGDFIRDVYLWSFRFQIISSVILYPLIHADNGRVSLYYYEPSYFAIAAIPYVGMVISSFFIKGHNKLLIDVLFLLCLLVVTKSANLMLIALLSTFFFFIFDSSKTKLNKFFILSSLFVFTILFIAILAYVNRDGLVVQTLLNIFHSKDIIATILGRAGNRVPRIELAWDVICNIFPSGVGPGVYKYFTSHYMPATDYSHGLSWLNPIGLPAISIWLEVLVECGALGAIGFYFFCCLALKNAIAIYRYKKNSLWLCIILVFFISLAIETSYLRIYFWAFMGIVSGIKVKGFRNVF